MLIRGEATRVGLIVTAALVALIGVYWFLRGFGLRAVTYPIYSVFTDARKLEKGADVRMAGVKVGYVYDVYLYRRQARVEMRIDDRNKIPVDSAARITSGALIGEDYVEILPGSKPQTLGPNSRIKSTKLVELDQILTDVGDLLQELKTSVRGANEILGDKEMAANVKEAVARMKDAAKSASEILESARAVVDESSPRICAALDNVHAATAEAAGVARDIRAIITSDARPEIMAALSDARLAIAELSASLKDARLLIASFDRQKLNQALDRLSCAAASADQIMAKLNDAATDVKQITGDPDLRENLKATARNTAEAAEQARELLTGLNRRFGRTREGPTPAVKSAVPDYGATLNALWNTDAGDYRFDANYTFAWDPGSFYRLGAFDLGENTRLNLQAGRLLGGSSALRYGLYASRLGVGYDRRLGSGLLLSGDLFRPNDPALELRAIISLGGPFGLYGGIQDVFDKDRRDLLVGVHYEK